MDINKTNNNVSVLQHAVTSRTKYEIPLHFGITFVRHGESTGNKLGVVQGHQDFPLSTLGISQAQQLGTNSVMNLRFSHIYSSDLQRSAKSCSASLRLAGSEQWCVKSGESFPELRNRNNSLTSMTTCLVSRFQNSKKALQRDMKKTRSGELRIVPKTGHSVTTTADIVRSFLLFAPDITIDQRLRERGFGVMEGLRLLQFRAELKKTGVHMTDFKPDGGESIADLRARVVSFIEDLFETLRAFDRDRLKELQTNTNSPDPKVFQEYQVPSGRIGPAAAADPLGASVLIFTHGGFIREALLYLQQEYKFCTQQQLPLLTAVSPNCGISTLTVKITEPKTLVSCMWLHRIYHVSDNVRPRPKLNQSTSLAARGRSKSNNGKKPLESSISIA